ncbi:MAG: type II toxin-antitoxin system RelE/ParE family toxin [Terracidiphilus sp.]|jgi:toxin HigB-1
MIKSFQDTDTQDLWETGKNRRIPSTIRITALKKLAILHWATDLNDLSVPSGNRLEALSGNRKGQHSIRINDQYRLCFVWKDGDAFDVEIVDYH